MPNFRTLTVKEEFGGWFEIKKGAFRILNNSALKKVISCSYGGVLVDEYQDCSFIQHGIICKLSEILPCRIVGDPLQGIFDFGGTKLEKKVPWKIVKERFEEIGSLETPHRWKDSNPELGDWIANTRSALLRGEEITLNKSRDIKIYFCEERGNTKVEVLRKLADSPDRQITGIFDFMRTRCHRTLRDLRNRYSVYEDADAKGVQDLFKNFDNENGRSQLRILSRFVTTYTAKSGNFRSWCERIEKGEKLNPRRYDFRRITQALETVMEHPCELSCLKVMEALEIKKEKLTYLSREYWDILKTALRMAASEEEKTVSQCVYTLRHQAKLVGRKIPMRCVSTTLLLKGLEFGTAVVLDVSEFTSAKSFYVAISRAKERLVLIGPNPVVKFDIPTDL